MPTTFPKGLYNGRRSVVMSEIEELECKVERLEERVSDLAYLLADAMSQIESRAVAKEGRDELIDERTRYRAWQLA
jgi:hypothetical protein